MIPNFLKVYTKKATQFVFDTHGTYTWTLEFNGSFNFSRELRNHFSSSFVIMAILSVTKALLCDEIKKSKFYKSLSRTHTSVTCEGEAYDCLKCFFIVISNFVSATQNARVSLFCHYDLKDNKPQE